MNSRQYKYITKVYEKKSITDAASELQVSQPSLSQMIIQVEKEIGAKIFNRGSGPNSLSLTKVGEEFINLAYSVMRQEKNLITSIKEEYDGRLGHMRVGISVHRAVAFLPEILSEFKKEYPLVDIEIVERSACSMERAILAKEVDIAFAMTDRKVTAINYIALPEEEVVVIAGKETNIAKKVPNGKKIKIKDLVEEEFVSLVEGHSIRKLQEKLEMDSNVKLKPMFETSSLELAKKMCSYCNCTTLYPKIPTTTLNIDDSTVNVYQIDRPKDFQHFALCHLNNMNIKPYIKRFIEISKEMLSS